MVPSSCAAACWGILEPVLEAFSLRSPRSGADPTASRNLFTVHGSAGGGEKARGESSRPVAALVHHCSGATSSDAAGSRSKRLSSRGPSSTARSRRAAGAPIGRRGIARARRPSPTTWVLRPRRASSGAAQPKRNGGASAPWAGGRCRAPLGLLPSRAHAQRLQVWRRPTPCGSAP